MKRRSTSMMLLILYGFLVSAMLLLTVAGVRCYGAASQRSNDHTARRSALSYVQTQAAACGGSVILRTGPEGNALCLREPDSDYETRIYLYEGYLCTAFTRADLPIEPEGGERLCSAAGFDAAWVGRTLLRISADGQNAYVWCPGGEGHDS